MVVLPVVIIFVVNVMFFFGLILAKQYWHLHQQCKSNVHEQYMEKHVYDQNGFKKHTLTKRKMILSGKRLVRRCSDLSTNSEMQSISSQCMFASLVPLDKIWNPSTMQISTDFFEIMGIVTILSLSFLVQNDVLMWPSFFYFCIMI